MNRTTSHSHRQEGFRHEFLAQRFMARELSGAYFAREVFGEMDDASMPLDSTIIRLVDDADAGREVGNYDEEYTCQ